MRKVFFFFKILFIFRQRGREGEREGEKYQCVILPLTHPPLGTWLATQVCALTGNQTGNTLVQRLALSPLSHTSQGSTGSLHDHIHSFTSKSQHNYFLDHFIRKFPLPIYALFISFLKSYHKMFIFCLFYGHFLLFCL